jgi:hypothetical protein
MKPLLTVAAVLETAIGIGLLAVPSVVTQVLFATTLDAPASLTVARVAETALLALGVACWLARYDAQSCAARGLVIAMALYNLGALINLGAVGSQLQRAGIGLWPTVILHAVMTVWCVMHLLGNQSRTERAP